METLFFLTFISYILGLASRPNLESLWHRLSPPAKPLRVVQYRFDTVTQATVIEPPHRLPMWITYTHAYIMRGELCKRKPLNVTEMKELTGLDWRGQAIYKQVLIDGGVITVVKRGGARWLVGKVQRRRKLTHLPYPRHIDPPQFTLSV